MFVLGWSTWLSPGDYSTADWAGLTFLVLLGAAGVAYVQAREARRLRKDQARPFVVIDFHPSRSTFIELKITNTGRTLATNVSFDFDKPLRTTLDYIEGRGDLMALSLFSKPMPGLAPGKEITVLFDQFPDRLQAGLPLTYSVAVSYSDPAGNTYERETSILDLEMYIGTGGITQNDLHDVHARLTEIAGNIKRWTDSGGLKVLTRGDLRRRRAELVLAREQRRLRAEDRETSDDRAADS